MSGGCRNGRRRRRQAACGRIDPASPRCAGARRSRLWPSSWLVRPTPGSRFGVRSAGRSAGGRAPRYSKGPAAESVGRGHAGGARPSDGNGYVTRSIYDPSSRSDAQRSGVGDAAWSRRSVRLPIRTPCRPVHWPNASAPSGDNAPQAVQLFRQGEKALTDGNRDEAMRLFRLAYTMQDQLDPATRARLQDHLQMLSVSPPRPAGSDGLLEGAAARQRVLVKQISADISRTQATAKGLQAQIRRRAWKCCSRVRMRVAAAPPDLDPQYRQAVAPPRGRQHPGNAAYIQKNLAQIELDEHNAEVHKEVDDAATRSSKSAKSSPRMVDEYNKAIEERRFAQAEVIAKRAAEMDPNNVGRPSDGDRQQDAPPRSDQHGYQVAEGRRIQRRRMTEVDRAAIPFNGDFDQFGHDGHDWSSLTDSRKECSAEGDTHRSPGDLEIEQKLTMPVSLKFKQAPLGEVLDYLAKVTQVNMYIDPQGLKAEGVSTDEPVTIDLARDIQLKSALALILQPLHLNYVIKDEVLKITSEDKRHGQVYTKSYPVADLVIPIPNFGPDGRQGINAALQRRIRPRRLRRRQRRRLSARPRWPRWPAIRSGG